MSKMDKGWQTNEGAAEHHSTEQLSAGELKELSANTNTDLPLSPREGKRARAPHDASSSWIALSLSLHVYLFYSFHGCWSLEPIALKRGSDGGVRGVSRGSSVYLCVCVPTWTWAYVSRSFCEAYFLNNLWQAVRLCSHVQLVGLGCWRG